MCVYCEKMVEGWLMVLNPRLRKGGAKKKDWISKGKAKAKIVRQNEQCWKDTRSLQKL